MATKVKVEAFRLAGRVEVDAKRAHQDLNQTEKDAKAVAREFKGLRGEIGSLSGKLGSGSGGDGLFGSIGEGLKMIPGIGMIAGQLGNVVSVLKSGANVGLDFNRTMEEGQIALEVLLKDAGKAKKLLGDLDKMSPDSPFDFKELVDATPRLLAFQFRMDEITRVMTAAGDASRGNKEAFDGITLALGQIRTKGKTNLEELLQLVEKGVPVFKYLGNEVAKVDKNIAKLTGDDRDAAIQKMVERGAISSRGAVESILRGIEDEFGGLGKRIANETASGLESQTRDNAGRLLGTASRSAFGGYKDFLRSLNATLGSDTVKGIAERTDSFIGAGIRSGEGLLKGLAGYGGKAGGQFVKEFEGPEGTDAHSPARAFIPVGMRAAQGFKLGFSAEMGVGGGLMQTMFQTVGGNAPFRPGGAGGRYDNFIEEAARRYGVDPNLIRAVIDKESSFKPNALSPMGAKGLMQLMDGTAKRYGVTNSFDPRQNIMGGTHYLADLIKEFKDLRLALAAYNAGAGAVRAYLPGNPNINSYVGGSGRRWTVSEQAAARAQGIPNNGQTPEYVATIMRNYQRMSAGGSASGAVPVTIVGGDDGSGVSIRDNFIKRDEYSAEFGGMVSVARSAEEWEQIDRAARNRALVQSFMPAEIPQERAEVATSVSELPLQMLPGDLRTFSTSLKATREPIEGLIKGISRMDSVMGAFGQLAGMLPSQQVGKKRGFFSKLLGGVAPFLSFIPGVGPILSQIARIGSSAIGGDYGGALMGAVDGFSTGGDFRSKPKVDGKKALGGPVKRGRTYIVGEHQAEIFEPDEDGFIHPSMGAYARSRGGRGPMGNVMARVFDRIEAHLQENATALREFRSMPPGEVVMKAAGTHPQAFTEGFMRHGLRDPRVVEWMQRRTNQ